MAVNSLSILTVLARVVITSYSIHYTKLYEELLGQRVVQRRRRDKRAGHGGDAIIRNLAELSLGQPVVHLDHGVGRYLGLQTLDAGGIATEFLTLEYAGEDKLYVPVTSLHLISRYSGSDNPPLHKLGGEAWIRITSYNVCYTKLLRC